MPVWRPWVVGLSSALFFFFVFIQVNMFNAISPALIKDFSVTAQQLGQISASYFYGNVLFLFAAGIILDQMSTRRLIIIAFLVCMVGTLLFSFSLGFWTALLSRLLVGMGGAFCFLSSVRVVSRWFPPRRMALVIGLIVTMAMIGGMVAQTPLTLLTDYFGWRQALWIDLAFGVLVLVAIMFFVQDAPPGYDFEKEKHHVSDLSLMASIALVLKRGQNWYAGLFTSLLNLPVLLLGAMWGGLYLVEVNHLSRVAAGNVTMMIFVGMIFGSPFFGWLSDRIRLRKPAMFVGAVATLAALCLIIYGGDWRYSSLMVLFFVLGFASGAQVLGYPVVAESNSPALTGTAEGMASTLIMAGGFTQPVFGWIMDIGWRHHGHHALTYSVGAFQHAMLIMPVAALVSIVMCFLIKETHCQHNSR